MEAFQTVVLALLAGTAFWFYMKLKERVEFLEHEVRWLRQRVGSLKAD